MTPAEEAAMAAANARDAEGCGLAGRRFPHLKSAWDNPPAPAPPWRQSAAKAAEHNPCVPSPEPYKPFPVDVLPEPMRSFVKKAAQAIGCDPSFIAMPLLSGSASAIGNTRRIQLKRGWTEPAIVWTAIVGDSGTLKSPAIELSLRAIRKRQRDAMKRHEQAVEMHEAAMTQYERELQDWKRRKDDTPQPVKPAEPVPDRCWCDDVTVEALAVLLKRQWRGLLLVRDELSGLFGGFDRYSKGKGGDAAKWLEMFGGRPMVVDRKSGTPPMIYIDRAAVSITGGIQPETLRRALGVEHMENGLAARLLFTCPPRKPKVWTEADIDPAIEAAIAAVFDRLYELQPNIDEHDNPQPVHVKLTSKGKAVWIEFFNSHGQEHAALTGELSAVWSKLEGYAARMALIIHFIRWAAGDPTLTDPDAVDEASMAGGIELSRWFGHEARRVYAILAESDEAREHRRLVELIARRGGKITARQLQQSSRQYGTADDAELALSDLVTQDFGRWIPVEPTASGGRPTRIFQLNERSTVYETPEKPKETRGSVDVDNVDDDKRTDDNDGWGEV